MGQVVGTAAAMCIAQGVLPRELGERYISELQQVLLRQDQYIPDLPADEPDDLAHQARVTASSAAPDCPPENVVNGVTRHRRGETNQWASAEGQPLPQWIQMRWPEPKRLWSLEVTFDTGFARMLTHTQYDFCQRAMVRAPQPETVRDVRIEAWLDGKWREVARLGGNYFRKRVVRVVEPLHTDALRLIVEATHGDPQARLFEVRAYSTAPVYRPAVDR